MLAEQLQMEFFRSIDGSDFPKLNLDEFNQMENKLESALAKLKSHKVINPTVKYKK